MERKEQNTRNKDGNKNGVKISPGVLGALPTGEAKVWRCPLGCRCHEHWVLQQQCYNDNGSILTVYCLLKRFPSLIVMNLFNAPTDELDYITNNSVFLREIIMGDQRWSSWSTAVSVGWQTKAQQYSVKRIILIVLIPWSCDDLCRQPKTNIYHYFYTAYSVLITILCIPVPSGNDRWIWYSIPFYLSGGAPKAGGRLIWLASLA